ncbi:hypothetical protein KQI85_15945, partial [Falcatimonas sp. MSJ-15]|uniref:hypothetical protein n=1 Tax=Falcatimonas sp. MSJ-15 TaxID=2841515 RepID=UPI001C11BCC8
SHSYTALLFSSNHLIIFPFFVPKGPIFLNPSGLKSSGFSGNCILLGLLPLLPASFLSGFFPVTASYVPAAFA